MTLSLPLKSHGGQKYLRMKDFVVICINIQKKKKKKKKKFESKLWQDQLKLEQKANFVSFFSNMCP